jgi:RNA polymerase sigma factor (sigma-70 family)
MPLIKKIARKYMYCGLPFEDLVQEGTIGLIKATHTFKPELGNTLGTYGYWFIKGEIVGAVIKNKRLFFKDDIDIPMQVDYDIQYDIRIIPERLARLDDRQRLIINKRWLSEDPAKLKELSAELGVSMERVRQIEEEAFTKMRRNKIINPRENVL